jgi:rubrerythrin
MSEPQNDYACNGCGYLWYVIGEAPEACPECESNNIERDEEIDDEPVSKG